MQFRAKNVENDLNPTDFETDGERERERELFVLKV
jgi:hypothetical protein